MVGQSFCILKGATPLPKCIGYAPSLLHILPNRLRVFAWDIRYPICCSWGITFFRELNEKESNKETNVLAVVLFYCPL
jgi:hypothetical protein